MKAKEIKPHIYWVGAIDWEVRDFHGYVIPRGTTYNNFLVNDRKLTLIDTVKHDFAEVTLDRINCITNPEKLEVGICNHIETDHASSWDKVIKKARNITLYMTERAKKGLDRHYDTTGWDIQLVGTGDELKLGEKTLQFIETPMLHWPDSMMTYVPEDRLLISQDAFGQHWAQAELFDDRVPEDILEDAVIDYYANILMPFGKLIKAKIQEIQKNGLKVEMIAPDHGIVWRSKPEKALDMYMDMAQGKAEEGVVIIYDTMWKSTQKMSRAVLDGVIEEGIHGEIIKLRETPMSRAITQFWKYRGAIVGTPTLNNIMYPTVAEFLQHLRGLRPGHRIATAFGSYGWGGGGVKEALNELKAMNLEVKEPGWEVNYRPSGVDYDEGVEFGKKFARQVKEYHRKF